MNWPCVLGRERRSYCPTWRRISTVHLRPIREVNSDNNGPGEYELVENAYVHGIMDGAEWRDEEFTLV